MSETKRKQVEPDVLTEDQFPPRLKRALELYPPSLSPSALAEGRRLHDALEEARNDRTWHPDVNERNRLIREREVEWRTWLSVNLPLDYDHVTLLSAAERLSQVEKECAWTCDDEDTGEYWQTSCGQKFTFIDAGPKENGMKHCCYCGKRLVSR